MTKSLTRAYRRWRFGKPVVVVSGLPRSGTSMAMKMLQAGGMGVIADGVREADVDNPRGYFEDERVKELHATDDRGWVRAARGRAVKVISWLLKDLPQDNNYKVLFMRRDLTEILASQSKMLARRGEVSESTDDRMIELYESHLWRVGYLFRNGRHFEVVDVHYREVLTDPRREAERIKAFLALPLNVEAMVGVVDESLYRNRSRDLASAAS